MQHKQIFKPLTKSPSKHKFGAFDIEGVGGPKGFVLGGVLTDKEYMTLDTPKQMIDYMRQRRFKGYWFGAHNLTYDYGILEGHLLPDDYALLVNTGPFKVYLSSGKNNPRYMIDSLKLAAGLPLAKLGDVLNMPKGETPAELINMSSFLSSSEKRRLLKTPNLRQYLRRDVEIVLKYLEMFQATINELGGEVRYTLASTAMDLFRRGFLEDEYFTPYPVRNDYARNAYYGGRVEPFRVGQWKDVNIYDINSLYPHVMRSYVYPHPNTLVGPLTNPKPTLIYDYEGVSEVTVTIPDCHIPPLPYRKDGKLFFPIGTMRGFYTHIELRKAEQLGAIIHDVHSTLYSEETCSPFANYVDTLYNLRLSMKASQDPRELVVKILLNSLYGKFGQRTDTGLRQIRDFYWWLTKGQDADVEIREIGGVETVLVDLPTRKQPAYINTLWAAYVTAYARLELLDYMLQAGDKLYYCDTDSVFIQGELPTSAKLGAMKQEYSGVNVEIFGPKAYLVLQDDNLMYSKCKGVPLDARLQFLLEGTATFTRPIGLLEAGHRLPKSNGQGYYPSEWVEITKMQHYTQPKRVMVPNSRAGLDCFLTIPHSVETLPE